MAAGLGFKTFTTGEVLTAADTNGYLMQGVLVFASAAARDAAITSPQEGQCCYLKDTDAVLTYSGAAWVGFDDSNAIQNSIVDAKGDLVAASGADTPARLAVGSNGETLVADSSTSTGLRYQSNFAAGKNAIINGAFNVWQRGTSFSAQGYLADRFRTQFNGSGATRTMSQQTFTPGTAPVAGYESQYFFRYDQSVAGSGGSYNTFEQYIEDVRTFANQTATFSFWAKASSSVTITAQLSQNFGSGGSATVDVTAQNAALTTSWQRFTLTFSVPSVSGKTIGTSSALRAILNLPLNSTFTIDTWGWQLEAGSVATAFQTATGTLQGELAACQRYYFRTTTGGTATAPLGYSFGYSATATQAILQFPVTMRINPSSTTEYSGIQVQDISSGTLSTPTAIAYNGLTPNGVQLLLTGMSGLTAYRQYTVLTTTSAGYLGFNGEL